MIPKTIKKMGILLLFLVVYFMVLAPILPPLFDSLHAWLEAYRGYFAYNASLVKYVYTTVTSIEGNTTSTYATVTPVTEVHTIDYFPLMSILLRLTMVLIPLAIIVALILRW